MTHHPNYVKRVIGDIPGDHIRIVNVQVYVNGNKLSEDRTSSTILQVRGSFHRQLPAPASNYSTGIGLRTRIPGGSKSQNM